MSETNAKKNLTKKDEKRLDKYSYSADWLEYSKNYTFTEEQLIKYEPYILWYTYMVFNPIPFNILKKVILSGKILWREAAIYQQIPLKYIKPIEQEINFHKLSIINKATEETQKHYEYQILKAYIE